MATSKTTFIKKPKAWYYSLDRPSCKKCGRLLFSASSIKQLICGLCVPENLKRHQRAKAIHGPAHQDATVLTKSSKSHGSGDHVEDLGRGSNTGLNSGGGNSK